MNYQKMKKVEQNFVCPDCHAIVKFKVPKLTNSIHSDVDVECTNCGHQWLYCACKMDA